MEKKGLRPVFPPDLPAIHHIFYLPMTITLNGTQRDFTDLATMNSLLEAVGLAGKPVVVEHNQVALLPREIQTATINDGDVIEIVQITAGG